MNMNEPQSFTPSSFRGRLLLDEPMARHVSWRAGGRASRAFVPVDDNDLAVFLQSLPASEPVCFVGLGSNLLVRDGGFAGTVVFMHSSHAAIEIDGARVDASAGLACPKLARAVAMRGLEGAEFLAGIPGTVGGAIAMNAGCYGAETWDRVRGVRTINRRGEVRLRPPSSFEVSYRHVVLRAGAELGTDEWVVSATFEFTRGDGGRSRARIRELLAKRVASQPLNLPNAGSVFRNPPGDYAARLIESCGLKGRTVGGARISEKHANFIVNPDGRASAADIEALIQLVRETVQSKCGVELIQEVRIIGQRGPGEQKLFAANKGAFQ